MTEEPVHYVEGRPAMPICGAEGRTRETVIPGYVTCEACKRKLWEREHQK